jgi:hypothetical protein
MNAQLLLLLKSRTFWVLVGQFIFNVAQYLEPVIPQQYQILVNGLLFVLASYFHINPSQVYGTDHIPDATVAAAVKSATQATK